MSRFWRSLPAGAGAVWWGRCDMCHWSGPAERFNVWARGEYLADLCDHQWCFNPQLNDQLRSDGWQLIGHASTREA